MTVAVKSPELTGAARCSRLWAEPEVIPKAPPEKGVGRMVCGPLPFAIPVFVAIGRGSQPSGTELIDMATVGFLTSLLLFLNPQS